MNCVEAAGLLDARIDGELEIEEAREVEAHLASCANCRSAAASLEALRSAIARTREPQEAPARLRSAVEAMAASAGERSRGASTWLAAAPGVAALLLAGWLAIARPWEAGPAAPAPDGTRVVYHIASSDNIDAALRTLKNHLDAAPGVQVVVVAHNNGIKFLLQGATDPSGAPYRDVLQYYRERGVEFRVCSNTLTRAHIDTRAVIPEAVLVPSGIAEIGRLQGREGYTYLRL